MPRSPAERPRWYLDEPYRFDFEANVVARLQLPDGAPGVVLDRTCFYPTSGGQPHDVGTLNGVRVLDVFEDDGGRVVHRLQAPVEAERVRGHVDASRRTDHMQHHSGQHLLSATCVQLFARETISFHLGADVCSIDLPGATFSSAELTEIERRANEIVWEGRAVRVSVLDGATSKRLRKPPPGDATQVRIVEIEDWDTSPCCGTHVARTNEIGMIKLLGQERVRDCTRLHFVCGQRALEACARMLERQDALVRLLTCHPDELATRTERLLDDARQQRKHREMLHAELARARAAAWIDGAPRLRGRPLVVRVVDGTDSLRPAAEALLEHGAIAVLAAAGERAQLLFTCPEDLDLDLRPALRAACATLGGRGGGPPHRVQGAGPRVEALESGLDAARRELLGAAL